MDHREVVVLSAVRTAIGKFGGALKDVPPTELAARVVCQSMQRSGLSGADIGHVVFGNVIHTEAKDMYLSRVAALKAGLQQETPALTLNRLCGSGLQAILTAAQNDRSRRLRRCNRWWCGVHEPRALLAERNALGSEAE